MAPARQGAAGDVIGKRRRCRLGRQPVDDQQLDFHPLGQDRLEVDRYPVPFLQRGAGEITTAYKLNASFSDILTGVILFFIIGCEFFINYRLNFRSSKKEG